MPRKALPSRTHVLDVFEQADGALHTNEVAERLGVAEESIPGLLRLLDDLVFDGILVARGQRFKLDSRGPASAPAAPPTLHAAKLPAPAKKKGLPPKSPKRTKAHDPDPKPLFEEEAEEEPSRGPGAAKRVSARRGPGGVSSRGAGPSRTRREGLLKINPRGFGFVASPTATGDDVFIGAESLGGAMHGDQVIVEVVARGTRGAEGQIVEVVKRGVTRVSGILQRKGKSAWVDLDDPRIRGPVVLAREIDQSVEGNSGESGQVVVAEITRFPENPGENPEGRLVAVLGRPGELSVEVNKVLLIAGIEEVHSAEAVADAESYGAEVPKEMLEGREDLTHIPLPTIDPDDARDHDDAIWVERTDSGGYEVWIAIADVSSYVRPEKKALDDEARDRGCSIYLPDRAIPMLPRALSSNLCSLLPDVVRLCLCVHAELDARGTIKKSRIVRGYMKSAAKLTYGGVARALRFTDQPPKQPKAEAMVEGLKVAYECSRLLRGRRMKRGALDFDLPEPVIKLVDGKPVDVTKRAKDEGVKKAYQLIEELMIFANEVVARWLLDRELPGVYRVHLPPDPLKLMRLQAMCEVLGIDLDVDSLQTPKGLSETLKAFADHPNAAVLNNLLLRSMKQATYDTANLGHFGLASDAYLHFTSPIRRYPDLVVHRVCHAALTKDEKAKKKALARDAKPEDLQDAAIRSSAAERRAMEVEREIADIYRCFYMIDRIGERFEGTVSAFVGAGAFVTLDDPFVDVMVKTEDLGFDYVIEDDGLMATSKRSGAAIRLGDRIVVDVTDVAILRRTVYAKKARGEGGLFEDDGGRPRFKNVKDRARGSRDAKGKKFPGGGGLGRGRDRDKGGPPKGHGPKKGKGGGGGKKRR
ncbi:MAG: VacB/RNase II family 3'-5' exoribonuclease [Labilithrix sp.]|nr:VacB/RNase II family 3'-5' exoribonuclease [Labilithrix sp.]MCW5815580.1 VacB/RNase II family 3'-5' exoribonuclease [Labilithrix sp.]